MKTTSRIIPILCIAAAVALTGCEKGSSMSGGGNITAGENSWKIGEALGYYPDFSDIYEGPIADPVYYLDFYSEGVMETGKGCLIDLEIDLSETDTDEYPEGRIPDGRFEIGRGLSVTFAMGESFDDPGTEYYPSEGTLTVSGGANDRYTVEFRGTTSDGIIVSVEYSGKLKMLPL